MNPRRPSITDMSHALNDILSGEPYAPPLGRALLVACFFVAAAAGYLAAAGLWTGLTGGSPGSSTRETLAPPAPPAPATPAPTMPAQPQPQPHPPRGIDLDAPIAPASPTSEPQPLPTRRSL